MHFRIRRKIRGNPMLYSGHYVDAKVLYNELYGIIPSIIFIGEMDASSAFRHVKDRYRYQVLKVLQHCHYNYEEKDVLFNNSIFILTGKRMIEIGDSYCHILHHHELSWARTVVADLAPFRVRNETNIIGFARQN